MIRRGYIALIILLMGGLISACSDPASEQLSPTLEIQPTDVPTVPAPPTAVPVNSLFHRLKTAGAFTRFVEALELSDLATQLEAPNSGPFTLFAPTDAALKSLPPTTWDALMKDPKGKLSVWLRYYLIDGNAFSAESLVEQGSFAMLNGEKLTVTYDNNQLLINNKTHITATDIRAANGILHIIDGWLIPPSQTPDQRPTLPADGQTLTQLMLQQGDLDIWLSSAAATPLGRILADPTSPPVTLFAPTDQAIAKLSAERRKELLEDSAESLLSTIQYHLLDTPLSAETLATRPNWTNEANQLLTVRLVNDELVLNDNTRIIATLEGSNGILHIIDNVLK